MDALNILIDPYARRRQQGPTDHYGPAALTFGGLSWLLIGIAEGLKLMFGKPGVQDSNRTEIVALFFVLAILCALGGLAIAITALVFKPRRKLAAVLAILLTAGFMISLPFWALRLIPPG